MKKMVAVLAGLALFMSVAVANATTLTLDQAQLNTLTGAGGYEMDQIHYTLAQFQNGNVLDTKTLTPTLPVINGIDPTINGVRYSGNIVTSDVTKYPFSMMFIGTFDLAGINIDSKLSGYDKYAQYFYNSDNSDWYVNLVMQINGTSLIWCDWTKLNVNTSTSPWTRDSATLQMDIPSLQSGDYISWIGFAIGGFPYGYPGNNPSNPDTFHMTVAPVPEPGTFILLGAGLLGLGFYGRRRMKA